MTDFVRITAVTVTADVGVGEMISGEVSRALLTILSAWTALLTVLWYKTKTLLPVGIVPPDELVAPVPTLTVSVGAAYEAASVSPAAVR